MLLPDDFVKRTDFNEPSFETCTVMSGFERGCSYQWASVLAFLFFNEA